MLAHLPCARGHPGRHRRRPTVGRVRRLRIPGRPPAPWRAVEAAVQNPRLGALDLGPIDGSDQLGIGGRALIRLIGFGGGAPPLAHVVQGAPSLGVAASGPLSASRSGPARANALGPAPQREWLQNGVNPNPHHI